MAYDERSLQEISEKYAELHEVHDRLMLRLMTLRSKLTNDKAKDYLMQGVGRRLGILTRCIENIFRIFPINQADLLPREDLMDLGINLHAFIINVAGLFDNLGLVFAFEYALLGGPKDGRLQLRDIGMFKRNMQKRLPDQLRTYLQSDHICAWYTEYSKIYRDAVAHRIPLYIPPSIIVGEARKLYLELEARLQDLDLSNRGNLQTYKDILEQQKRLGTASPVFVHSEREEGRPMYLHAQVIADYATVEEVTSKCCKYYK